MAEQGGGGWKFGKPGGKAVAAAGVPPSPALSVDGWSGNGNNAVITKEMTADSK